MKSQNLSWLKPSCGFADSSRSHSGPKGQNRPLYKNWAWALQSRVKPTAVQARPGPIGSGSDPDRLAGRIRIYPCFGALPLFWSSTYLGPGRAWTPSIYLLDGSPLCGPVFRLRGTGNLASWKNWKFGVFLIYYMHIFLCGFAADVSKRLKPSKRTLRDIKKHRILFWILSAKIKINRILAGWSPVFEYYHFQNDRRLQSAAR